MSSSNAHSPTDALSIVGIGGSAGSLQPLRSFVANLPPDTGAAYVIATHHPSGEHSHLPEILGPQTAMPVQMVEEGETLLPNRVYVALPSDGWIFYRGQLVRSRKTQEHPVSHLPAAGRRPGPLHSIDAFFRSLADEAGHRALAIVLSGTGSDGTLGIQAVKSLAGMVMAQDPDTAEFGDMPANAIATGQVDYVLPPGDMPATLTGYLRSQHHRQAALPGHQPSIPPGLMSQILNRVRHRTGHDFSGYKASTLTRRLERRMDLRQIPDPSAYLDYLQSHPEEVNLLFQEFLISVTNFFRDRQVWDTLGETLLPAMLQKAARTGQEFRAWVVGCATGEEAFTLAILIRQCLVGWGQAPEVRIFATDVDQAAIETARRGRYPAGIAHDVSKSHLQQYFSAKNDTYLISREVRDMVVFAEHNALQDPPFTGLDLVTCRNLLIYLERDCQERLLALFRYALRSDGLLVLGPSESMDHQSEAFFAVEKDARIYRVAEGSLAARLPVMPGPSRFRRLPYQALGKSAAMGSVDSLSHSVERLIALQFGPPAVVVNDQGEVVYVHGRIGKFLEPASGPTRNRLLEMARPGLRAPLSQALQGASGGDADPISREVRVQTNDNTEPVRLEVQRIRMPTALVGFYLVAFHPAPDSGPVSGSVETSGPATNIEGTGAGKGSSNGETEARLKRELESLRQDKQVAVEEMHAANEELQSMNEELQSMNEEHQSSNEELEAAKEEVESLNQELRSVNAELRNRVDNLTEVNDDLKNLLDSSHLATLFLDEALNIKRFTPAVQDLIAVRPTDIGRPLSELTNRLRYDTLLADAEAVLDTLVPRKVEVQTQSGHWYLLRIQPYRSTQNVIRGVVCTFQDIQVAQGVARGEAFFRAVVDTVREPLLVLNTELHVVSANDGFYRTFPLTPEVVEGKSLFDLANGQWDNPELRARLLEVLPRQQAICDFELSVAVDDLEPAHFWLNACRLELEEGGVMILLTMDRQSSVPEP